MRMSELFMSLSESHSLQAINLETLLIKLERKGQVLCWQITLF